MDVSGELIRDEEAEMRMVMAYQRKKKKGKKSRVMQRGPGPFLLLPLIIGSAVVPVQIIIDILLLKQPEAGLAQSLGICGWNDHLAFAARLVFGLILNGTASTTTEDSS